MNQCTFANQTDVDFAQSLASAYNYNIAKGNIKGALPAFANNNFICFQDPVYAYGCIDVTKVPAGYVTNFVSCTMFPSETGPYKACFMGNGPNQTAEQMCQSFKP